MDLDIEMNDAAFEVGAEEVPPEIPLGDDILQNEAEEPGEVLDDTPQNNTENASHDEESRTTVPNRIHIRGLDSLHTNDIKAYVQSHFGSVDRVEWIDDTSANLVFSSDNVARDAFKSLSTIEVADVTALAVGETLPAKPVDGKPEISLSIRLSVQSDKKQSGAALRSRYYLLHPEHDPEERRRKQQENRSRYRDRDGDYGHNGRGRRRSEDEVETFEASMYDDVPHESRRRRSPSRSRSRSLHRRENRGKELFGSRASGRDRSASPRKDLEGDEDMRNRSASSSALNHVRAKSLKDRISAPNSKKELFPLKDSFKPTRGGSRLDALEQETGSAELQESDHPKVVSTHGNSSSSGAINIKGLASQKASGGGAGFAIKGAANARELFPDKLGRGKAGKELFPGAVGVAKKRQKAEDLFG